MYSLDRAAALAAAFCPILLNIILFSTFITDHRSGGGALEFINLSQSRQIKLIPDAENLSVIVTGE